MIPYLRNKIASYVNSIEGTGRTLEIGSFDVNGGVKDLFMDDIRHEEYIGTDMREGPGVDFVVNSHDLLKHFSPDSFDTIVCLETFEHDDKFWLTMQNINQLIRVGGYLMLSAPTIGYAKHYNPSDYWRFTEEGFTALLWDWDILSLEVICDSTLCALARKKARVVDELELAYKRIYELEAQLDYMSGRKKGGIFTVTGKGGKV